MLLVIMQLMLARPRCLLLPAHGHSLKPELVIEQRNRIDHWSHNVVLFDPRHYALENLLHSVGESQQMRLCLAQGWSTRDIESVMLDMWRDRSHFY